MHRSDLERRIGIIFLRRAARDGMDTGLSDLRSVLTLPESRALAVDIANRLRDAILAEDLDEVYTLRVAIETLATRRAAQFATTAHLAELQTVVDTMAEFAERGITEQEAAELDIRFHDLIYAASNHRRLVQTWETLRPQIHILLLNRNVAHEDFREYLVKGHQWILDAIARGDGDGAVETIEDHLRGSYSRVLAQHSPAPVAPLKEPKKHG
jgi:DNA-binding GntR family transcriptional regulator